MWSFQTVGVLPTETSRPSWLGNPSLPSIHCFSHTQALSHFSFAIHITYINHPNIVTHSMWSFNAINICLPDTKQHSYHFVLTIVLDLPHTFLITKRWLICKTADWNHWNDQPCFLSQEFTYSANKSTSLHIEAESDIVWPGWGWG